MNFDFKYKKLKKFLKIFFWTIVSLICAINIFILVTGKFHLYYAMANTIFQGRLMPTIDDSNVFHNRVIETHKIEYWPTHPDFSHNKLDKNLKSKMEELDPAGFLVIKNDSLFYEHYWDGYHSDSITNSFSMSKTVVSILIGIAVDEGKIKSIDEPVGNYLDQFAEQKWKDLTIRHCLTMSSGSNWWEGGNPLSDNTEAYYGWDLKHLISKQEPETKPGVTFNYQSGNTQILAFVLEKATGMNISEYSAKNIWHKVGAEHKMLWNLDDENGVEKAFCCLYAVPRDFARIGQLYLNKGTWKGQRIVSEKYVNESLKPANLKDENGNKNIKYGLSWWLTEYKGEKVFYARGILGQYIICLSNHNMVIVRTGDVRGEKDETDHPEDIYWYIEAALKMI